MILQSPRLNKYHEQDDIYHNTVDSIKYYNGEFQKCVLDTSGKIENCDTFVYKLNGYIQAQIDSRDSCDRLFIKMYHPKGSLNF